ncbi:hypothetical protein [Parapedobacter sp. DT-150]|uniref:hypothetical protein n=1 Tax=Parapedobacter sp. DT-150 TaxID=3396162 RepID=UPI003F1DA7ED
MPDSTDDDTNININVNTYPSTDLPDVNPGSAQWDWAVSQLKDAHDADIPNAPDLAMNW